MHNPLAAQNNQPQFKTQTAGQFFRQRRTGFQHIVRLIALVGHQALEGEIGFARRNLFFAHTEFGQIFLRQIHPPFLPIHRHILPEINQLQSRANTVALRQAAAVVFAV